MQPTTQTLGSKNTPSLSDTTLFLLQLYLILSVEKHLQYSQLPWEANAHISKRHRHTLELASRLICFLFCHGFFFHVLL